jgi:hypothetical protein
MREMSHRLAAAHAGAGGGITGGALPDDVRLYCQVKIPEKSFKIPYCHQGKFPIISEDITNVEMMC